MNKLKVIIIKTKPIYVLELDNKIDNIIIKKEWGKKVKQINENLYHISSTIIKEFFNENKKEIGNFECQKIEKSKSITHYYGFKKIKGTKCHSSELSKRFINDWLKEFAVLYRYEITCEQNNPIKVEIIYDNTIDGKNKVGKITEEELKCFHRVLNEDGEIMKKIRQNTT